MLAIASRSHSIFIIIQILAIILLSVFVYIFNFNNQVLAACDLLNIDNYNDCEFVVSDTKLPAGNQAHSGNQAHGNINKFKVVSAGPAATIEYQCLYTHHKGGYNDLTTVSLNGVQQGKIKECDKSNSNINFSLSMAGIQVGDVLTMTATDNDNNFYYVHYTLKCHDCILESQSMLDNIDLDLDTLTYQGEVQLMGHRPDVDIKLNPSSVKNYQYVCTFQRDVSHERGIFAFVGIDFDTVSRSAVFANPPSFEYSNNIKSGYKPLNIGYHQPSSQVYNGLDFYLFKVEDNTWSPDYQSGPFYKVNLDIGQNTNYTGCGFSSEPILDVDIKVTSECQLYLDKLFFRDIHTSRGASSSHKYPEVKLETYLGGFNTTDKLTVVDNPSSVIRALNGSSVSIRQRFNQQASTLISEDILTDWLSDPSYLDRYVNSGADNSTIDEKQQRFILDLTDFINSSKIPTSYTNTNDKLDYLINELRFKITGHYSGSTFINWNTQQDKYLGSFEFDLSKHKQAIKSQFQKYNCDNNAFEVDVFADFNSETCYVYMSQLIYSHGGNLRPDMHIKTYSAPTDPHMGIKTINFNGGHKVVNQKISQRSSSKILFELNFETDETVLASVKRFKYSVLGYYNPSFKRLTNSRGGVTITIPIKYNSNYQTNLDLILNTYRNNLNAWNNLPANQKASIAKPKICQKWTGGVSDCQADLDIYMPNAVADGNGAYYKVTNAIPAKLTPAKNDSAFITYGIHGPSAVAVEDPHDHDIIGYNSYTHNGRTYRTPIKGHIGPLNRQSYISEGSHTATIDYFVPKVEIKDVDSEIANMLNAQIWKGHHIDTEHALVNNQTPVSIKMSYRQPDLVDSPGKAKVTGHDFKNAISFDENIYFDFEANYVLRRRVNNSFINVAGGNFNNSKQVTHTDPSQFSNPGTVAYEWYVDSWKFRIRMEIIAYYDDYKVDINTAHHNLNINARFENKTEIIYEDSWSFEGQYSFCTRTLAIQAPDCQVFSENSAIIRNFDSTTVRGSNRKNHSVFAVGKSQARSKLTLTNNNPFKIQTTSAGQPETNRNGPGPSGYYIGNITTQAEPTYSITPSGVYKPTANYNTPRHDPHPPTPSGLTDLKPRSVVVIGATSQEDILEQPVYLFEPGKYDSTWRVRWSTAANDGLGGVWRGDEFFYDKCINPVTLLESETSIGNFYVYAEPPTCQVEDYIVHEQLGQNLDNIRITLYNPNAVPMPIGIAQLRVNTPTPGIFETETANPSIPMIIPKNGSLTLKILRSNLTTATAYSSRYISPYDNKYISMYQSFLPYNFTNQVQNVTRQLGEFEYETHVATYIGNEDFTTDSSLLDALQDSWFEKNTPNEERVIGPTGKISCSQSDENKIRIVRRPYVKFFYGGLGVGGRFSDQSDHSCSSASSSIYRGYVLAHADNSSSRLGGSSSELAIQARDDIFGFYSASLRTNHNQPLTGLTLNNIGGSGFKYYGGQFGGNGICIPNYWIQAEDIKNNPLNSLPKTAVISPINSLNAHKIDLETIRADIDENDGTCYKTTSLAVATNDKKTYCQLYNYIWMSHSPGRTYYHKGDLDITNNALSSDLGSVKITIYVEGDIYIKDNILNNRTVVWHHPTDIGYIMFVVKGNIYIDPKVSTIDALLVALPNDNDDTGQIWTCMQFDDSGNRLVIDSKSHWNICGGDSSKTSKLVVNGGLASKSVRFGRITSTVHQAKQPYQTEFSSCAVSDCQNGSFVSNNASEEINLVPEYFLATPSLPASDYWINSPDSFAEIPLNF